MLMNHAMQVCKAIDDPLQLRGTAPMLLGREVDYPARAVWGFVLCDKHTAGPDFLLFASAGVRLEFSGNAFLNINARPLPITPAVLTGFTKASTWASRRLPCMNLITEFLNISLHVARRPCYTEYRANSFLSSS